MLHIKFRLHVSSRSNVRIVPCTSMSSSTVDLEQNIHEGIYVQTDANLFFRLNDPAV